MTFARPRTVSTCERHANETNGEVRSISVAEYGKDVIAPLVQVQARIKGGYRYRALFSSSDVACWRIFPAPPPPARANNPHRTMSCTMYLPCHVYVGRYTII